MGYMALMFKTAFMFHVCKILGYKYEDISKLFIAF